jgi:hypothetical protein
MESYKGCAVRLSFLLRDMEAGEVTLRFSGQR